MFSMTSNVIFPQIKWVSCLHFLRHFSISPQMWLGIEQSLRYSNCICESNSKLSIICTMYSPPFSTLFPLKFKWVRCLYFVRCCSIVVHSTCGIEQFGRYNCCRGGSSPKFLIKSTRCFPWLPMLFFPKCKWVSCLHFLRHFNISPQMWLGIEQSLRYSNCICESNSKLLNHFWQCIVLPFPLCFHLNLNE